MGGEMSAADGHGFLDGPAFARSRGVVSLAAQPAATLEDGRRHVHRRLAVGHDLESDHRPGHRRVGVCSSQRPLQCLRRGAAGLGRDACRHPPVAWLAATPIPQQRQNFMNSKPAPDLILHSGKIATLDSKHPEAKNLAVQDGRIVGVDDAEAYDRGANTRVIDLKGRRVIPGLNDSHLHVIRGGLNYNMELRWDGVPSLADGLRMLKEQAERTPPGQWVRVVGGWSEFQFAERRMPTLNEINTAAPDTPVFILHLYCRALLNHAALRACGYTKDTPNPPGGEIQRNGRGNPTRSEEHTSELHSRLHLVCRLLL